MAIVLHNLDAFFQEVEPKVEAISGEESDTLAFMNLMSIFNQVPVIVARYDYFGEGYGSKCQGSYIK